MQPMRTAKGSAMSDDSFVQVACDLEEAGLVWLPEIGDEVIDKPNYRSVSVLVDPHGMTPSLLRSSYLWLPTVEQILLQFEARQAILFHAGLELAPSSLRYKTVVRTRYGSIESEAESLRAAVGLALHELLRCTGPIH